MFREELQVEGVSLPPEINMADNRRHKTRTSLCLYYVSVTQRSGQDPVIQRWAAKVVLLITDPSVNPS